MSATTSFEMLAILQDATVITALIDPSNFVSNDIITEITDTSTTRKLTFNTTTFQDQDNYSIQVRNIRSDGLPGVWSDINRIQVSETQNYIVEIIPSNLVIDSGLKWTVEDSNGLVSGPYSYGATLEYGDYTLKVLDSVDTIVYEEEITVSSTDTYKEVLFETSVGSLTITLDIPLSLGWNTNLFQYTLISDSGATVIESTSTTFEDLQVGYYNLMIKYQTTDILYLDDIYSPIEINADSNNVTVTINTQSKITSLE
ncbi:hypothetical protein HN385_07945 [archaeon]|nr:hypothetical protein [archaeon]